MTVFHHVIKSMGTRYDPLAGKVVAHIVGGDSVGNTQFKDLSANNTPVVTVGSMAAASASGPFGPAVSIKPGSGAAGVVLNANDNRFQLNGGLGTEFTIDGWFKMPALSGAGGQGQLWTLHTTGYTGNGGGNTEQHLFLAYSGTSSSVILSVSATNTASYSITQLVSRGGLPVSGQWVYVHVYINTATNVVQLRVGDASMVAGTTSGMAWNKQAPYSFTVGAQAGGSANSGRVPMEFFAFRVTKGLRAFDSLLLTSPWPTPGGTTNWLGAPAGASTPIGQRVLGNGEVWVVPPGITSFSAVAVGCKLSIAGTDVLAATWPVLGDGGGQGGSGGTGHSNTVTSWSNGPPTASFGGGSGTVRSTKTYYYYGGGGGAGGYTGNGGNGVNTKGTTASAGQGGGGGGGATKAVGGGVGLKGQGASGTGGLNPGQPGSADGTTYGGGKPGTSGGPLDGKPGNNLAWRNNIPVTQGQVVLCTYIGESGQTGAARLMWGDDRSFPNDAGDVE